MTYWHMQLHPDDKNWRREKELLEKKSLIGLGEWEGGQSQINQFKNEMQIGDIVLIKRGALAIALTKVIGSFEENDEGGIDWFKYRRKVEVLDRKPNIEKANRFLGFVPEVELDEGLKLTFEWWKKNISKF